MLGLLAATAGGTLLGVGGTVGVLYHRRQQQALEADVEEKTQDTWLDDADDVEEPGHSVELEPPEVRKGLGGLISQWRHRAKAVKMAEKGYVRWYKLGSTLGQPEWIKPDYRGTGVGEYYDRDDDITYLFPKDAMLPESRTGAWVAMHRTNDADPLNLRDPVMTPVPADRLQEIIDLQAEAEKPGLLEDLDISAGQAFIIITVVLFLVYAASTVMG
jgi:hypothetical protein